MHGNIALLNSSLPIIIAEIQTFLKWTVHFESKTQGQLETGISQNLVLTATVDLFLPTPPCKIISVVLAINTEDGIKLPSTAK